MAKKVSRKQSEYAKAGVDYTKIEPFKKHMVEVGKKTLSFPNRWGVHINRDVLHAHGAVFEYTGKNSHMWCKTQEGLGNLNWIAEWMYMFTGKSYYDVIGRAAGLLIAIDVIAQGAMPVIWTDEVAAGDSEWFADEKRSKDYADGCYNLCREIGMALPAGESPALRYLIKAEPPVKSAPSLSGSITGIIVPKNNLITGKNLRAEDKILGVRSSGLHSNGISLIIKRAMELEAKFLSKIPTTGRTLGEECLIPIPSYVSLVKALLDADVMLHSILPATGDGLGKLAYDKRQFTYKIYNWVDVPPIFQFMRELGVSLEDCLKTFNWGIGMYFFVHPEDVQYAIKTAKKAGYDLVELGVVKKGPRRVIVETEGGIILTPPGE